MRRYSEAVRADLRWRMTPPQRQSVARISKELGIHVMTLHSWCKCWQHQGEVVPATQKVPEGWGTTDKFTVVMETAGLNTTESSSYCRERGLFPEQVDRWCQAAQDANVQPLLTMSDQKDLQNRHQDDQREIKRLQQELRRKDKALAEAAALLIASKIDLGLLGRGRGGLSAAADRRRALEILDAAVAAGARACELARLLGVGLTMLQRWRRQFKSDRGGTDGRQVSHCHVAHRLSGEERQRVLLTRNQPQFAALPPGQIVPILADRGLYIGSERSFYRVLHAMDKPIGGVAPGHHRSPGQFHGCGPQERIKCGAGTSPISLQRSAESGFTSTS